MTPARYRQIEEGQSAIARKVLQFVPIAEAWECKAIMAEMHRATSATVDKRVIQGCLAALVEAGLVTQPQTGLYRRVPVPMKTHFPSSNEPVEVAVPHPLPSMPSLATTPLQRLSRAVTEVRGSLVLIEKQLKEVEEAALSMELQIDAEKGKSEQLAQLRRLLKEMGE